MFQLFFERAVSSTGRAAGMYRRFRRMIVRYHDPVVRYALNGQRISLRLSHDLPFARALYPVYASNLTRLAGFVRRTFSKCIMIDVGANVGDSYCMADGGQDGEYLLVEGDDAYFDLLTVNTRHDTRVTRVHTLLSDAPSQSQGALVSERGTAHIVPATHTAGTIRTTTLDELVNTYPAFQAANLLKIDVDGYDSRVLMGGKRLLRSASPVLFFEHHPRLLALAGDDDLYVFAELAKAGYHRLILYDLEGLLIGAFSAEDSEVLRDLTLYAKCRDDYGYDVCCFPDTLAAQGEAFLAEEKGFFRTMASRPETISRLWSS